MLRPCSWPKAENSHNPTFNFLSSPQSMEQQQPTTPTTKHVTNVRFMNAHRLRSQVKAHTLPECNLTPPLNGHTDLQPLDCFSFSFWHSLPIGHLPTSSSNGHYPIPSPFLLLSLSLFPSLSCSPSPSPAYLLGYLSTCPSASCSLLRCLGHFKCHI